jgi:hypothetical protein
MPASGATGGGRSLGDRAFGLAVGPGRRGSFPTIETAKTRKGESRENGKDKDHHGEHGEHGEGQQGRVIQLSRE